VFDATITRAVSALLQPSFDDLSTPLFDVTFCVLDLETTGGSPRDCAITEIGAVKYRGGELLGSFQTLVDPGLPIPPSITILTGITEAMVVQAPDIAAALPSFLEFIGDAVIVGHNIRFDMSFLNAAAARLGYAGLGNDTVDTAGLARRLVRDEVRNLRLHTLAAHFRSPVTPIHRALDDARATAHVLHGLLERAGSLGVTNLDDLLQLPRARGAAHYSKIRLTNALPRRPGVYLFRDRHGVTIYVGKATNLRSRVRQYFYGDQRRSIGNLMRELDSVDHIVCPTTLEAEITELRLIHAHRPRYNRRSRPPKSSHWVKLTDEVFPRLSVVRTLKENGLAHLGPFRSKTSADMVVAALWDATMIRRCTARPGTRSAPCAPAQMGVALCPCDGNLDVSEYRPIVDQIVDGIATRADLLLGPLTERMRQLALELRYEEASWARDRHEALARSIEMSRAWVALGRLGVCEMESDDGSHVLVDHGRLVSTWSAGSSPPLRPAPDIDDGRFDVPDSVEMAEEAHLIWRWIESRSVRIVDATGTLALPARPVVRLGARSAR
jgi:DNA polymerase-3 subunit epsilon